MAELQAVADMARSDAIQVFNYGLRKEIENWMTNPATGGITLDLSEKSWDQIKRDFAEAKFGGTEGREFAKFTASTLKKLFSGEAHFGNYAVKLEGEESLEEILKNLTEKSVAEDDFFEIVECPTGDPRNCPKGTFYVNLKVAKLTEAEYEMLPRITVLNKSTGDEIKEIILPRANFRIYVPLRVFKALAEARALAHYPLVNGAINSSSDKGLFSARAHNMIEEMGIGLCDKGVCNPRGNPFTKPSTNSYGGMACPGDSIRGDDVIVSVSTSSFSGQYNAADPDSGAADSMETVMRNMINKMVCGIAEDSVSNGWLDADPNDSFDIVGGPQCSYIRELIVIPESMISKNIIQLNDDSTPGGNVGGSSGGYSPESCPREPENKIGMFRQGGELKTPSLNIVDLPCSGTASSGGQAYCTEVDTVKVKLWFKENNPTYMVDKTTPETKIYSITLLDTTFEPFTANWEQGSVGSNCMFSKGPETTSCSLDSGWTCTTHLDRDYKNALGCAVN